MKYSKIRTYLKNIITDFDADFKEHKDAFNTDNIARTNFNKAYHITYSVPSIDSGSDVYFTSSATASIQFYFKGYRCPQTALDEAMDTVATLSQSFASISNVSAFRMAYDFPIQQVSPTSQVPEPLQSNDNSIIINLDLNLEIIISIC